MKGKNNRKVLEKKGMDGKDQGQEEKTKVRKNQWKEEKDQGMHRTDLT